jgi:hypothetical protein
MYRIALLLLMTVLWTSTAIAENFFDKLGRELDRFGESVGREIEGALKRPGARQNRMNGLCVTYNGQGTKTDQQRCLQTATCSSQQRCTFVYQWPSGVKTVVDVARGRQPLLNGKDALHSALGDVFCVTSLVTTNRFCFVKPGQHMLPRIVDAFNPGGGQQGQSSEGRQVKIGSISDIITTDNVNQFFDAMTLDKLAPVNALNRCQDELLARVSEVISPVPYQAKARVQQVCVSGAARYGERILSEVSNERIADTKAKPATLQSLQDNHWFRLQGALSSFTAQQRSALLKRYNYGIQGHLSFALTNAIAEITRTFRSAIPFEESADVALRLCDLKDNPPGELVKTCQWHSDQFNKRVQVARCNRAIAASGASPDILDMPMQASGTRYNAWPVRKVICAGVENKPNYRITVDSGSIPFLTSPSLQIYQGKTKKLLDVELRVGSERDGRSFGKLLLDIATGENEREVPEAAIGCVLNFIKCP